MLRYVSFIKINIILIFVLQTIFPLKRWKSFDNSSVIGEFFLDITLAR